MNQAGEVLAGHSVSWLEAAVQSTVHSVLHAVQWTKPLIFTGYWHCITAVIETGNHREIHDEYSVLPLSGDFGSIDEASVV